MQLHVRHLAGEVPEGLEKHADPCSAGNGVSRADNGPGRVQASWHPESITEHAGHEDLGIPVVLLPQACRGIFGCDDYGGGAVHRLQE